MAKLRITFEIDSITLFDALKVMKGDTSALGARVVGVMMTGERPSMRDDIGMAAYGITVTNVEKAPGTGEPT